MTHADAVRTLAAERYLLDEMSEIERFSFEEHFFDCIECAEDVRAGSTMRQAVKGGLLAHPQKVVPLPVRDHGSEQGPKQVVRRGWAWRPAVVVPWAAAAMLALAVGYQSLAPARGGQLQVSALTPVTIRPDSRGAVPTVSIGGNATAVTLALEADAPAGSELTYVLRSSAGQHIADGRVTAAQPGVPLLILVPVWTLTPNTQYSLAVQGAADGPLIGEYRFATDAR